jgi:putative SOS response-associated peptidase YedK
MPVIVDPVDFGHWLNPAEKAASLQALLHPYPSESMEAYPISTYINNPRNEGPRCVERLTSSSG